MVAESENKQKLKQFFSQEYKSLKRYVRSKLKNSADSEPDDIIQDVAMRIFERADSLDPIKNIAGFVYRSVRNKIIDILRTNNDTSYLDERFEDFAHDFSEYHSEKSENAYSDELKTELYHAIFDLKPKYKEIVFAINFEGYTFKALAKEKNVPVGTLLSRHHRALALLNEKLEKFKNKQ